MYSVTRLPLKQETLGSNPSPAALLDKDMTTKSAIDSFIESQKTLRLYGKTREALRDVLLALPDSDFTQVTQNLFIVALHEGVIGQAMHFPNPKGDFKVLQLTLPEDIPDPVIRFVIAHELGHVMQGRNWQEGDGKGFEAEADVCAQKWGFPRTSEIAKYIDAHWHDPVERF